VGVPGWREDTGIEPHAFDRAVGQRYLRASRVQLGDAAWATAWTAGRILPMATAVEQALQGNESPAHLGRSKDLQGRT
jgi:hypothetical protein